MSNACVLLSGGMDSTACLHWSIGRYENVRALGFDYGQPHRESELSAASSLALRLGVKFEVLSISGTLSSGLLGAVPRHDDGPLAAGVHRAFVPGRNLVFLSMALCRVSQWWQAGDIDIVIGACWEDTAGFPDCTEKFIDSASVTLSAAVERNVIVVAPYSKMTKREMLSDVQGMGDGAMADIQKSWSCYAGVGPCGECTPCFLRDVSLRAAGIDDLCKPVLGGGR